MVAISLVANSSLKNETTKDAKAHEGNLDIFNVRGCEARRKSRHVPGKRPLVAISLVANSSLKKETTKDTKAHEGNLDIFQVKGRWSPLALVQIPA
ncbi:MAG TPA: hypothetical protein VLW06_12865 [Terriglobales bacterium]|nr:hypothetical protein [Terriglobales bacterium]